MQHYNKTFVAFFTAIAGLLGGFGIDLGHWGTSEVITASSTLLGAGLVYAIPNK